MPAVAETSAKHAVNGLTKSGDDEHLVSESEAAEPEVTMSRARLYVDFNELIESNLVLLSKGDTKLSSTGETVVLREGMPIEVCSDDVGDNGETDNLIACGVVERNTKTGWACDVKWCCRIDGNGIRPESDLKQK